jgi:hypothetical protein
MKQFRSALVYVWLIVAAIGGVAAAAPFIVPATTLHNVFPPCEARARNSTCPACGLTTGFVAISGGYWDDARQANAAAIPLFALLAANFSAALGYSVRKLKTGATTCK